MYAYYHTLHSFGSKHEHGIAVVPLHMYWKPMKGGTKHGDSPLFRNGGLSGIISSGLSSGKIGSLLESLGGIHSQ